MERGTRSASQRARVASGNGLRVRGGYRAQHLSGERGADTPKARHAGSPDAPAEHLGYNRRARPQDGREHGEREQLGWQAGHLLHQPLRA